MNPLLHPEQDDLERQLQSQLERYAPEAPDRLWTGVEAQLPKRRRRRSALWWWLASTAAALMLAGIAYRFAGLEKTLLAPKPRRAEPSQIVKQDLAITNTLKHTTKGISTLPIIIPGKEMGVKMNGFDVADKTVGHPEVFNPGKTAAHLDVSKPDFLLEKLPVVTVEILQSPQVLIPEEALALLEPLSSPLPTALKNNLPKIQSFHFPVKTKRERRWQFGITAAPVWVWQLLAPTDPNHTSHMAFAEHQQGAATGWQQGLAFGYEFFPRWQLTTGLSRRQTTQISSHNATLRLMDGICLNPNDPGPKEYEFQYALYSSNGESNLTVHIAQVDTISTMPDDEPFILDMRTTSSGIDWVLPLTAQRNFEKGPWKGFVQAGVQINLPGSVSGRVDHFTEACKDLCFTSGRMPTLTITERRHASLSWLIGAGMEYRVAPRWGLSVTPTFFGQKGQTGLSLNTGLNFKL